MKKPEQNTFQVGYNFIHRGHYMKPAINLQVPEDRLRAQLTHIIDDVSRSCRIWVDGKLAWVWDGGKGPIPEPKSADEVLHDLGLHHLAQTPAPSAAPAAKASSAPGL